MSLVSQLETASRTTVRNQTLSRQVNDLDEHLVRGQKGYALLSGKRVAEFRTAHEKLMQQLEEVDKGVSGSGLRQFDPSSFLGDCTQKTPLSDLVTPKDLGSTEGVLKIAETLRSLNRQAKNKTGPLGAFLKEALASVDKAVTLLQETTINSDQWASIPDSLLTLIGDVLAQDEVSQITEEHHETIKRMGFSAEELNQQQQQAVVDGDMKESETLYFKKITVQEAMVEVFNKAFSALDGHNAEYFVEPMKRVHQVHNRVTSEMSSLMQANEHRRNSVEMDLERLRASKSNVDAEGQNISTEFRNFLKQNDADLASNTQDIEQLFHQISEIERKIASKLQDRTQTVQRRMGAITQERQRQEDVSNFTTFYKQQLDLLEATLHTTEVCEEVSDILDEMLCNGCNALEQSLRDVDRQVEEERQQFHSERLSHFRDLYLTLGDLQYKKERNLEELDKKIQHVHIQQELAMETLNPKAKEYSQMKKQLTTVKEEMQSQINVLEDKGLLHIEAFKPTEVALIESGKQFVHPVDELRNRNEKRATKLLEYHNLMSQASGEENSDPTSPPKSVEAELKDIEEERQRMQWRKPKSATGSSRDSLML